MNYFFIYQHESKQRPPMLVNIPCMEQMGMDEDWDMGSSHQRIVIAGKGSLKCCKCIYKKVLPHPTIDNRIYIYIYTIYIYSIIINHSQSLSSALFVAPGLFFFFFPSLLSRFFSRHATPRQGQNDQHVYFRIVLDQPLGSDRNRNPLIGGTYKVVPPFDS